MPKALNQRELAKALDMTEGRVSQLKKQGMPTASVEEAQAWRVKTQNVAARKRSQPRQPAPKPAPVSAPAAVLADDVGMLPMPSAAAERPAFADAGFSDTLLDEDFQAARTRREVAEANLAELKEAEQKGQLLRADAVRAAWAKRLASTRDALLQIPSRLAPVLAAENSLDAVALLLEAEIRQALAELSRGEV